MSVYIEYVIIDNMVLTYVISNISYRVIACAYSRKRSLICALTGTAVAITYPFISSPVVAFIVKLVLWLILSFILFYKKCKFIVGAVVFLVVTFAFGGVMLAVSYALSPVIESFGVYHFSVGIVVLIALITWAALKKIVTCAKRSRITQPGLIDFQLSLGGKTLKLVGLIDTGNRLYDSVSGFPIVVVKASKVLDCLSEEQLTAITLGKRVEIGENSRYVTYSTVSGGSSRMLIVQPSWFKVRSGEGYVEKSVMVGLSFSPIRDSDNYDAIVHPSVA